MSTSYHTPFRGSSLLSERDPLFDDSFTYPSFSYSSDNSYSSGAHYSSDSFAYSTGDTFRYPVVSSKLNPNAPEFVLSAPKGEVETEECTNECSAEENEEHYTVEDSTLHDDPSVHEEEEKPLEEPKGHQMEEETVEDVVEGVENEVPQIKEETVSSVERSESRKIPKSQQKTHVQGRVVSPSIPKPKKQPEKKKRNKKRKVVKVPSSPREKPQIQQSVKPSFNILHHVLSFSSTAIQRAIVYLNHQETTVLFVNFLFLLLYTLVFLLLALFTLRISL